ncbi:MAG: hypothetical protein P5702_17795 [Limnospira sp. PMC 1291.21]|uniref:Uncharacterized protein n=2 Tax=Limnospira TaxID=2596745 RepID=A0A9P1KD67_9CYAN|nr:MULTISPECIES: hypothetical protein [Limnospira]RAQ43311.1 hypothetical protein B9S53_11280 [Arthrospira sp. O9.13F]MDT9179370.1 hypothetical protein [Limnospira sp. PMC 1238.20]MDT9190700.1 hypothetical protein [Limnospira sp. PMC 894.15]MDT9191925.1 hypothetical protein [Limnospira sp. PMC 1245.20]MDT9200980.1 hypothetical protein [Limnospira sp. PMC 1042.18]
MGKKSLKITVNGLNDDNYADVAHQVVKAVKSEAPNSDISILGASPEVFEGSSKKKIKGD